MEALLQNLRYGLRMLVKKPGFTLMAGVVLALGIGANTAVFSLVNAFLLKPLLIRDPQQMVGCYSRDTRQRDTYRAFSYPNYADIREGNTVFASLTAHDLAMVGLSEGDAITRRVFADVVTSNYFETFGVPLFRGRGFTPAEERPASDIPVTVISYPLWKRMGADPGALGKSLRINGRIFTIVGIAPEEFTGTTALISPELYLPLGMFEAVMNDFEAHGRPLASRDNHSLMLVGRLRPGVTAQMAGAPMAALASRMEKAYPAENKDQTIVLHPLSRMSVSTNPTDDSALLVPSLLLSSLAGVVLLIASLNMANMMLVRGTARRKEIALRLALGAGRRNILSQLFTEGLLLALLGGAAGLAVAYWSTSVLIRSLAPLSPIDLVYSGGPDVRVLAVTIGFCVLSTLLFGLGPAWNLSRADVLSGIKAGEYQDPASAKRRLFSRGNLLVMGQIALSLMLLTAAGLFIRSAMTSARVEPGFQIENGLLAEVDPSLAGYDEAHGRQIYRTLLDRLSSIPGVESASLAATVPFGIMQQNRGVQRSSDPAATPSNPASRGSVVSSRYNIVTADYFKTLGIPLLQGRSFLPGEAGNQGSGVAVIDSLAAKRLWPNGGAIGKHLRLLSDDGNQPAQDVEVVGVAGAIRESLVGQGLEPHVYVPFGQAYQADMNIHLRMAGRAMGAETQLLEAVRREIRAVDSRLPVLALKTLPSHLDGSFDIWIVRTAARMFAILGGMALLLAMVGLYGVRAYTIARRTREIGIRMALGASAGGVQQAVLQEGLAVAAIGASVGLVISLGLGRLLACMLYQVSGADPLVFLAAPALLIAVSLLACYLPARKASRVDPMVALRID